MEEGYNPAKTKTVIEGGIPYTVDYWSYYSTYPTGSYFFMPRRAKFNGSSSTAPPTASSTSTRR